MLKQRLMSGWEGRARPSRFWPVWFVALVIALGGSHQVLAHAELERALPPVNGVVATAPRVVEIWFSEEVKTEETTIQVIGPGGIQVDLGDATVDLQDAERKHVTVSLRSGSDAGEYTVQWKTVSGLDSDEAQGSYTFTVDPNAPASPASAQETQVTVAAGAAPAPGATVTPAAAAPVEKDNFDSQGFGISVATGIAVGLLIFFFWRVVRPKNPRFRG